MTTTTTDSTTRVILPGLVEPSGLRIESAPIPTPGRGQLLVRVEATGISFAEQSMRRGRYFGQPRVPLHPGLRPRRRGDRGRRRRRPRARRPPRRDDDQDGRLGRPRRRRSARHRRGPRRHHARRRRDRRRQRRHRLADAASRRPSGARPDRPRCSARTAVSAGS